MTCKEQKNWKRVVKKILLLVIILSALSPGAVYGYCYFTREPAAEPVAQVKQPGYGPELDKIDKLVFEASACLKRAAEDVELRSAQSVKVLKLTDSALAIIDALVEKYPDRPDIEERLKSVSELRHAALKDSQAM